MRIWPGRPYPLGATWDGAGVNFALFSEHATKVELCLFDSVEASKEAAAHPAARTDRHGLARLSARRRAGPALRLPGARALRAGQGPSVQPQQVVLDPYAKAIGRDLHWDDRCSATRSATRPDLSFDERDSAAFAPLAAVVDTAFTWGDDRRRARPGTRR